MAKPTIPPRCKYHPDVLMAVFKSQGDENAQVFFSSKLKGNVVQLGEGYTFHIYECPQCTYIEFHDIDSQ